MPSRRAYLSGFGSLLATIAGCVSGEGDPETLDPTPTEDPIPSPTSSPKGPQPDEVTVDDIGVKKAIRYASVMGSGGVLAADGKQYVVASVQADEEITPASFTFEAGDESWPLGLPDTAGAVNRRVAGREGGPLGYPGLSPDGQSYLAFVVPSPLSEPEPRIRYDSSEETEEWSLDANDRERLAASEPRFELESLSVPDTVRQGETLEVSMTVRNVADTGGRFLVAAYWPTNLIADDDESHVVDRVVDAGAEESVSLAIDTQYTAREDGDISLQLRGHVGAERSIYVRDTADS